MTVPAFDRFHFQTDGVKGSGFFTVAIPPEISERTEVYEIPSEPRVFPSGELTAEMQIRRSADFDQSFYEWVRQSYGGSSPQKVCVHDEVGNAMYGYIRSAECGGDHTTFTVAVTEYLLAPWYQRWWWRVKTWWARVWKKVA